MNACVTPVKGFWATLVKSEVCENETVYFPISATSATRCKTLDSSFYINHLNHALEKMQVCQ